jgi:cytochrome c556
MKLLRSIVIGGALTSTLVSAAAFSPGQAVDARKNRYRELGAAFKSVNDQLRSGNLIKVTLRSAARTVSGVGRDQYQWFPAGSNAQAGFKTQAMASIWLNPAGFREAQGNFQRQADMFLKVVETGNAAQIGAQAKALGQTCAACHRKFRAEKD